MPHASSVMKVHTHFSQQAVSLQDAVTFLASKEHHDETASYWVWFILSLPPTLLTVMYQTPSVTLGRIQAKQDPVQPVGGTGVSSSNSGMASTLVHSRV